ncbi:MAG TPA: hypothetical protein VMM76_28430 [Pirellulaceae bacterium]|nr:hypothetical protein [Pirellulaceae bacterium]
MHLYVSRLTGRATHLLGLLLFVGGLFVTPFLTAAEPELKSVFPSACQLGESVEITLIGTGLDQDAELYFSREGLTAESIEKGRFHVSASADAALGDCDLWVATSAGMAGPRRFSIVPYPVLSEQEAGDTREQAQPIAIPSLLSAKLDKRADLDWFAFAGEQDQQITIRCRSSSLDGSAQPAFTLFEPDGGELIHSSPHQLEPQRIYRLPAIGTYRLLVHDRAYRQDDFSFYQLEVTSSSPDATPVKHQASLLEPDDLIATIDVQNEQERSRDAPQTVQLPCRVTGQFFEQSEVDWFRFHAKKDQVIHLEVFGQRLGQQMDVEAAIYNADGKLVATASDFAAPKGIPATLQLESLDPVIDWKVPADGDYLVAVRDLYGGSVFGADRDYELILETLRPRCFVIAMPSASKPGRGVFVKRGGKAELSVHVVRNGGFTGPVTVRTEEALRGVTLEPCVLDGKEISKAIKLSAAKDAPTGFQSLRLVSDAAIDSDKHTNLVRSAVQLRAGTTRRIDELVIYVSDQ